MQKLKELIRQLLPCRSPKQNNKNIAKIKKSMNIEDFIQRVIVIDNKPKEVKGLLNAMESIDVTADFIDVSQEDGAFRVINHNRQLVFIDLLVADDNPDNYKTNISKLIKILSELIGTDFGPYGLVVWSKHPEYENALLERLNTAVINIHENQNNNSTTEDNDEEAVEVDLHIKVPPLFVICLNKGEYFGSDGGTWDINKLLQDLNAKLQEDTAASFFIEWYQAVKKAAFKSISSVFNISDDYGKRDVQVKYLLMNLAHNETGSKIKDHNLTMAAYKSFNTLLNSELYNEVREVDHPDFKDFKEKPFGNEVETLQTISAKLNMRLFIESDALPRNEILPGYVYKINKNSPLGIKDTHKLPITYIDDNNEPQETKDYQVEYIAVELTPPCDSAHKKVYSRLVGGYIFDLPLGKYKKDKHKHFFFEPSIGDKTYALFPIILPGSENVKAIVFDFRYLWTPSDDDILNSGQYKLLFKFTQPLFADILQKFSSHASRLGLNSIDLAKDPMK